MKNCSNCGQINQDNQAACSRCGAFLTAPNNAANFAQNQPPGFNQAGVNQPLQLKKKFGIGKILLIVGGLITALVLVVGVIIALLVTQTLQWKITEKWRVNNATMGGVAVPLGEAQGTTVDFNWDQTFVTILPNGTTERGTYKVVDEQTVSMTDRSNTPITSKINIDGNNMTMTTTKNNVNITLNYSKVE